MQSHERLLGAGRECKRGESRKKYFLLISATCCLTFVAGFAWTVSQQSGGATELEERHRHRDSDRKHHEEQRKKDALKRVSSVQLVSDIKKVLLDVESTLQHSRMRR